MNVQLDPARLSAGADAIQARADDMAVRRSAIERSVDALLAGWRGSASAAFETLWREWHADAGRVIEAASASAVAIRSARDDLMEADVGVGESQDRLRGRLA